MKMMTKENSAYDILFSFYKVSRRIFPKKTIKEFADDLGDRVWDLERRYQSELEEAEK